MSQLSHEPYEKREKFMLEFFAYETLGASIGHVSAAAFDLGEEPVKVVDIEPAGTEVGRVGT